MLEEAKKYNVKFGSLWAINCDGVFNLVGEGLNKQPFRFREDENGRILLNCTLLDENGDKVVVLHKSNPIYSLPNKDEYDISWSDDGKWIKVTNKNTKDVWLDFKKIGLRDFQLKGKFYYPKCNVKVVITDEYIKIDTTIVKNFELSGSSRFIDVENVIGILPDCSVVLGFQT